MRNTFIMLAVTLAGLTSLTSGLAREARSVGERQIRRALSQAFPNAPAGWEQRIVPDQTMATCTAWHNQPPKDVADAIKARERQQIRYPARGGFIGDWRRGETIAQSGHGMRFTDTGSSQPNGGNCYACHELSPTEVSFGTLGVSLKGYGRLHGYSEDAARTVYEKIFNSQALVACSLMPRFGAHGILTIDQIRDLVALLMDPDSPVNAIEPKGIGSLPEGRTSPGLRSLSGKN